MSESSQRRSPSAAQKAWASVRRPRQLARSVARRGIDLSHLVRGRYRPTNSGQGLRTDQLAVASEAVSLQTERLVHTSDFLPDRWSFAGRPFESCPQAEFARGYLNDPGFDFKSTRYYQLAVQGHLPYPCKGVKRAESTCRGFIYLIDRLRRDGYQPERYSPIVLAETVDGSLLVVDGKHRLSALLALGIDSIPVVTAFHNEIAALYHDAKERCWPPRFYRKSLDLLDRVGRRATDVPEANQIRQLILGQQLETWANIYHPIPFYEFRDLTTQVHISAPYQRLGMICARYPNRQGLRVLDLGCNIGFYSFSLAKRGADVTGVELRSDYAEITKRLAKCYRTPVNFINGEATPERILESESEYDVTLCFSMLQWIIDQKDHDYGMQILDAISRRSRALFFDIAVNEGKACLRCTPGHELAYVYGLLRDATAYEQIDHIGDVHPYGFDTRHVFYCQR